MSTLVTRSASASPSVAHIHAAVDPQQFPLNSIDDVIKFFRRSLEQYATQGIEPDLTLLSIIAGFVEASLTSSGSVSNSSSAGTATDNNSTTSNSSSAMAFPAVTHELVAGLYKKFQSILSIVEKPKSANNRQATREIIKKVSDVIWHSLIRSSHKDRAHLQNLYSYLSGNKLDCFGVALAVVAGCQLLGYRDVHLAISEDHAWVVFGGNNKRLETIEVTWHGKGSEDKRGQDVTSGIESGSWLYLSGLPVVCDRGMEVAAIAAAINISLSEKSDCVEVAELQQKLLWLLYDMGYLKKYPMALGTLGELEEINSSHKPITCEHLYREAIQAAQEHYKNHHVYPHTYQGNYYNRLLNYRRAFAAWANAADVIRLYTYSCRDDEEIYKELLDIANEMIPFVMKTESSGHSARSILRDSEVFANLLRFYDGICQWEEDSLTPILHIGWAKPLVNNITKFDYDIRSQVVIKVPEDDIKPKDKELLNAARDKQLLAAATAAAAATTSGDNNHENNETKNEPLKIEECYEGNNNNFLKKDDKNSSDSKKVIKEIPKTLADLTAACGEKILNPEFLLQGGNKPFAEQNKQQQQQNDNLDNGKQQQQASIESNEPVTNDDDANKAQQNTTENNLKSSSETNATMQHEQTNNGAVAVAACCVPPPTTTVHDEEEPFEFTLKQPVITLYSQKMKGLKDLLLAEKLNTHAILLQVTAQSVASSKKVRGTDKMGNHTINSTYATANIIAAAAAAAAQQASSNDGSKQQMQAMNSTGNATAAAAAAAASGGSDSIAASRPKRTRRE